MYKIKKSALRRMWGFMLLMVLLTSCGAPDTSKSFVANWGIGYKTTCTPIYNEDGSFAQSTCKTYCKEGFGGIWLPNQEDKEDGKFFEVLLPIENISQFKDFISGTERNLSVAAFCSSAVEFDNGLRCLSNGSEDPLFSLVQNCSFTCASGIPVNVTEGKKEDSYSGLGSNFAALESSYLEDKYCSVDSAPASTEPPTEAPTEAPTEPPSAEPHTPILTGDVTYCDIVSRSVNLRLVDGFSTEEFSHQVTIGGEAMSCKVNEGNATLLTCTFPATTKFPAAIQVSKDGNVVNEFEYNGSNCVVPEQQAGPKDPGSGGESSSGSDCWDLYVPFGLCIPKP